MSKFMAFTGTVALLSSLSFGWSISGTVTSEGSGRALAGVKVTSFNYAGFETTSAEDGSFTISNDGSAIHGTAIPKAAISFNHNVISISGIKAQTVTVSVMDALGKVAFSQTQHNVMGSMMIDLNKSTAKGAKFLRVNADGSRGTYQLGKTVTLLKEGDPLPFLQFALEGYQNATYQAQAEVETGVQVRMTRGSTQPPTSSATITPESSASTPESSATVESSSSAEIQQVIVDCAGKTAKAGDQTVKLTVKGSSGQREFIMHVPSAYKGDKAVPLVIDYHPIGGSGSGQMGSTTYKKLTDPEGVISLYPQGTTKTMGPGWNVGPCCSNDDDLEFTREMIKYVKEKACIDPQRIYATGFSMGGGMSNHVACMMSDVFAAVAPAAMDLNKTNSAQCTKARPISVINFRGQWSRSETQAKRYRSKTQQLLCGALCR